MRRRSSEDWFTVIPRYPVTNTWGAWANAAAIDSTAWAFSVRFTALLPLGVRGLGLAHRRVDLHPRAHGGGHGDGLHVLALGSGGLGPHHRVHDGIGVVDQALVGERE